jgi:hypothetical protein
MLFGLPSPRPFPSAIIFPSVNDVTLGDAARFYKHANLAKEGQYEQMQGLAHLPRILLPRTPVNKGKNKKSLGFTSNFGSKVGGEERTTHPF